MLPHLELRLRINGTISLLSHMSSQCGRGNFMYLSFYGRIGYAQKTPVDCPVYNYRKVLFVQLSRNPSLTRRTRWTYNACFILAITFVRNILQSQKYLASYARVARRNLRVSGSLNACNVVIKTARSTSRSHTYVFWTTDGVIEQTANKCVTNETLRWFAVKF